MRLLLVLKATLFPLFGALIGTALRTAGVPTSDWQGWAIILIFLATGLLGFIPMGPVKVKPSKRRGFWAWIDRLVFKFRARRVLDMCKRRPLGDIDEMHKEAETDMLDALKQNLSKQTWRDTMVYYAHTESFLTLDIDDGSLHLTQDQDLKVESAHRLVEELIGRGAISFDFQTEETMPWDAGFQKRRCIARLEVVMPKKEEAK